MRLVHGLYRTSRRLQQVLSLLERILVHTQVSQGHRLRRQPKVLQLRERIRWQMRTFRQEYLSSFAFPTLSLFFFQFNFLILFI